MHPVDALKKINAGATCMVLGLPLLFNSSLLPSKVLEEIIVAKLQGPWVLLDPKPVGSGYAGVLQNAQGLDRPSMVIWDFLMNNPAGQPLGTTDPHWIYGFKIDASHKPVRIEIVTIIDMAPSKQFGIMRFKNDRLEICVRQWSKLNDPGNPTKEFVSSKDSRTALYIYRRPNWYAMMQRMGSILLPCF